MRASNWTAAIATLVMKDERTKNPTATLGLRCEWCDAVFREPVGYPNPEDHGAWTDRICQDCKKHVEDDALLPAHAIRDTQRSRLTISPEASAGDD